MNVNRPRLLLTALSEIRQLLPRSVTSQSNIESDIFLARFFFRGIYFPLMNKRDWLGVITRNRKLIFQLTREGFTLWLKKSKSTTTQNAAPSASHISISESPQPHLYTLDNSDTTE